MKKMILAMLIVLIVASGLQAQENNNNNDENENETDNNLNNNNDDTNTYNINNTNNTNNTNTYNNNDIDNTDNVNNQNEDSAVQRGKWGVGIELPGIGLGIGASYTGEYGWMIPNTETTIKLLVGVILAGESWYGEGNKEPSTILDGTGHSVRFMDYYFKAKVTEGILGDHHKGYYWLDAGIEYMFKARTFAFIPALVGKSENLYQEDEIIGDDIHHQNTITLSLTFDYSNDSVNGFRRVWGFRASGKTLFEFGSEFDKNIWAYLGFKTELHGWIPFVGKYFFMHLAYFNNSCVESFTKTQLPFYAFPSISNGGWKPVRGIGTSYRVLVSNAASIELKTRPLGLEKEVFQRVKHLDKAISFFSLGAGIFADFGHVRHPIDYSENLSLGEVIKYSIGAYAETKLTIAFGFLSFTLHLGAVLYHNDTPDGKGTFSPKFYFAFG